MTLQQEGGVFVSVEGADGVGKTSALPVIRDLLLKKGYPVVCTREPGGTPVAEGIRNLVLGKHDEPVDADTELMLMYAARRQHIVGLIRPALEQGKWVISDRFIDSSWAYQIAGGAAPDRVADLERWAIGGFRPDLTLLLHAPTDVRLARMSARGDSADRMESKGREFHEHVARVYLDRWHSDPQRITLIDASRSKDAVAEQIRGAVARFLRNTDRF